MHTRIRTDIGACGGRGELIMRGAVRHVCCAVRYACCVRAASRCACSPHATQAGGALQLFQTLDSAQDTDVRHGRVGIDALPEAQRRCYFSAACISDTE